MKAIVTYILVPPSSVAIRHLWDGLDEGRRYTYGEMVQLNCTATAAKPKADLQWFINGQEVNKLNIKIYLINFDFSN